MSSDRAAVAREVLMELRRCVQSWEPDSRVLGSLTAYEIAESIREVLCIDPAPPAPETVTVDWDGASCVLARNEKAGWNNKFGLESFCAGSFNAAMCDRIASDARVIAELETQLEETARSRDGWQSDALREAQNAEFLRSERDAALRALEEKGAGTLPKGASASEESQAAGSLREAPTSPAPIPLGETMEVDGVKWARTELGWNGGAWRYRDSSTVARVLTALYRARHPVATRETVERVAKAIDDADSDSLCPVWDAMTVRQKSILCDMARAALTAAGLTLEDGA